VIEFTELWCDQNELEENVETFRETANVANPVEDAVHISIHTVEGQIELEADLEVHVVYEFVRSAQLVALGENTRFILG